MAIVTPSDPNVTTGGGSGPSSRPNLGGVGSVEGGISGELPGGSVSGGFSDSQQSFDQDVAAQRAAEEAARAAAEEARRLANQNKRKESEAARREASAEQARENQANRSLGNTEAAAPARRTFLEAGDVIGSKDLEPEVTETKSDASGSAASESANRQVFMRAGDTVGSPSVQEETSPDVGDPSSPSAQPRKRGRSLLAEGTRIGDHETESAKAPTASAPERSISMPSSVDVENAKHSEPRSVDGDLLSELVKSKYHELGGKPGYRKILKAIKDDGYKVSERKVRDEMRRLGLNSRTVSSPQSVSESIAEESDYGSESYQEDDAVSNEQQSYFRNIPPVEDMVDDAFDIDSLSIPDVAEVDGTSELDEAIEDVIEEDESDEGEPSVQDDEKGPEPWTEKNRLLKAENRKLSIKYNRAWFENETFKFSGDKEDESGKIHHSTELQREIDTTLKFFDGNKNEESTLLAAAMILYGVTPDRAARLFAKGNLRDQPVSDAMTIDALRQLRKNVLDTGQPFAYTFGGNKRWYNSERFPLVPTESVAKFLGNGRKNNQCRISPSEILTFSMNQFKKKDGVMDKIHYRADDLQRIVLKDAIDAIEQINGTSEHLSGRTGNPIVDGEVTIREIYEWYYDPETVPADILEWIEQAREDARNRAQDYLEANDESNKVIVRDEDGRIINTIQKNRNGFNEFWRIVSNYVRGLALLRPTLMIGAVPQHAVRNLEQKLSLYFTVGWDPQAGSFTKHISGFKKRLDEIKFSPEFYEVLKNDDFKKAMDELIGSYAMGNRDVVQRYLADEQFRLGDMSMVSDLKSQLDGMTKWERFKFLADHNSTQFISVAAKLSSARWFMTNADNKRFIEMLYWRFSQSSPDSFTKKDFENAFMADPIGALTQFAKTSEGNDAILFTLDNTISGMNVMSEPVQRLMSRNGLTSAGFMTFVSMFPTYGINMAASIFPMTRTANYIAAHKIKKFSVNHAEKRGEKGNRNRWQDLAIGGNTADMNEALLSQTGFWINLTLDVATLGVRTAAIGIVCIALAAIGVEPPDDDEYKFVWGEWKVGGVPIKFNWWARDVFGVITPAAIPILAAMNGDLTKTEAFALFSQGIGETLAGTPWARAAGLYQSIAFFDDYNVTETAAESEVYDRAFENYLAVAYESGLTGKEAADYATTNANREVEEYQPDVYERYSTMFITWGLSTLSNWIDIPMITDMYNEGGWSASGNLAKSATMQYTPDPTDDADAVQTRDWADAQIASVTRRNPVAAGIMNFISGLSGGTADYAKEDMPLQEMSDPLNMTWYYRFQIYDNMTNQDKMAVCDDVIALITSVDDPQILAQNGVVIPYATQQATLDYIYANINKCYNDDYIAFSTTGVYNSNQNSAEYNQALIDNEISSTQAEIDFLYEIASRLKSNQIPKTPAKYNIWETNYSTVYLNADGTPATAIAYALNPASESNPNGVRKELYASGDHKSATTPTLSVDQRYNTYDNQTPVAWQGPLTDIDMLEKFYKGTTLMSGWNKGEDAFDVLTGGGMVMSPVDEGWDSNTFVVGSRAWVPVVEYDDNYLLDPEREDAWNPLGEIGEKDAYKPYSYSGYSRSYGGGSGGSSYNPKIYSNPAYSLSSDRPATMYSKIPYSTTFDYLRPEFETKGSREAYKRSDI